MILQSRGARILPKSRAHRLDSQLRPNRAALEKRDRDPGAGTIRGKFPSLEHSGARGAALLRSHFIRSVDYAFARKAFIWLFQNAAD